MIIDFIYLKKVFFLCIVKMTLCFSFYSITFWGFSCNFFESNTAPLIIDADALNILADNKEWLRLLPENTIITPHPKELERLIGSWKDDFVHPKVGVSIHRLRQHAPFPAADRLIQLADIVAKAEFIGAHGISKSIAFDDLQLGIIVPLVRISDLGGEIGELLLRLDLCRRLHPRQPIDAAAHRASIAAAPTRPDPAAKSSTRLPATSCG